MAHSFHVHATSSHLKWSRAIPPTLTVPSGSELTFDLLDGGGNQITRENAADGTALRGFDFGRADPGIGPVYVKGAGPGDVLKVEFLELTPAADFGWTAVFPGFGILSDEFPEPALKIWDLKGVRDGGEGHLVFKDGIHIPYRPFLGMVGVAPEQGEWGTVPPLDTGGNIDTRWIGVGSTLFLPVKVPGALLSCGDGHAAQGDGEVCGTAVEMRTTARIRVSVEKEKSWVKSPWVLTAKQPSRSMSEGDGREYMCLGVDSDIREATRKAVRGVIDWLEAEKGLSRVEAYMLTSVAGNLKMCEVVDMPNYAIGCAISLGIFQGAVN